MKSASPLANRRVTSVEFGIAEAPVKRDGGWFIVGRCVTDISVGDRFIAFVPHRKIGGSGVINAKFVCDDPLPIDLTTVKIMAYGKEFSEWSAGMTAGLFVLGEGDNLGDFGSLIGGLKLDSV